jgi:hypothetical protein
MKPITKILVIFCVFKEISDFINGYSAHSGSASQSTPKKFRLRGVYPFTFKYKKGTLFPAECLPGCYLTFQHSGLQHQFFITIYTTQHKCLF